MTSAFVCASLGIVPTVCHADYRGSWLEVLREDGIAEEDSLAENVQRVALHPLDQFRAFQTVRDQGVGEGDIAARFFVSPAVVKQRLKLAAVSPRLLDLYAEDAMTLEQLMALAGNGGHARQDEVWDGLAHA